MFNRCLLHVYNVFASCLLNDCWLFTNDVMASYSLFSVYYMFTSGVINSCLQFLKCLLHMHCMITICLLAEYSPFTRTLPTMY